MYPTYGVILLIAFLCVHCEDRWIENSSFNYFEVVTAWFLVVFSVFFLMHLFRLQSKITCINWMLTEFLHYAVGGILVFIASIVVAVKSYGVSALIAGSVSAFLCFPTINIRNQFYGL
uniref:CKLF-like MARVEL transmembrane domain containing 7 n=1 Tax=Cyprinus carpio TaxID=7962 RepID=A0A8C1MUS3_CYPCA